MYHYACDWCGERIDVDAEAYVKAPVQIVHMSRDYRGERDKTAEPTRFFHVNSLRSRDEWDRLGIEVKDENIGDCCYTRALRAIEGLPDWDTPDAGMEWRLVPVGARVTGDGEIKSPAEFDPLEEELLWRRIPHRDGSGSFAWVRTNMDSLLPLMEVLTEGACRADSYVAEGIETVGDLRAAIKSGKLLDVRGVGPKRAAQITEALEDFLARESGPKDGQPARAKVSA